MVEITAQRWTILLVFGLFVMVMAIVILNTVNRSGQPILLIPLYIDPDDTIYERVSDTIQERGKGGVILKPPDDTFALNEPPEEWEKGMTRLGIFVRKFVRIDLAGGRKPISEVEQTIDGYRDNWQQIDGIFFDNVALETDTYNVAIAKYAAARDFPYNCIMNAGVPIPYLFDVDEVGVIMLEDTKLDAMDFSAIPVEKTYVVLTEQTDFGAVIDVSSKASYFYLTNTLDTLPGFFGEYK